RYWSGPETVTLQDAVVTREHRRIAGTPCLEAHLTIRQADGAVTHDHIRQRPYLDGEVEAALHTAGFAITGVERYDPFSGGGTPTKALWSVARSGRAQTVRSGTPAAANASARSRPFV